MPCLPIVKSSAVNNAPGITSRQAMGRVGQQFVDRGKQGDDDHKGE